MWFSREDQEVTENKYIVFESCLKELHSQCLCCGGPCKVETNSIGSLVNMKAKCPCGFHRDWNSQPMHGQMPIGNLIFSAGILYSGSSPAKVLQYFKHTGIQFISIRAYNYIQSAYLVPSVRNVWQRHQENILSACQGKQVNLGGDGRCDSPGYCAKYGSYSCKVQVRSWQLLHSSKNSSGKIMTTASCCTRKYTWVLVTGYIVSIKTSTIHQ